MVFFQMFFFLHSSCSTLVITSSPGVTLVQPGPSLVTVSVFSRRKNLQRTCTAEYVFHVNLRNLLVLPLIPLDNFHWNSLETLVKPMELCLC